MVALPLPDLPAEISALRILALDLRWTWSHEGDALWERVDARALASHAQSLDRAAEAPRRDACSGWPRMRTFRRQLARSWPRARAISSGPAGSPRATARDAGPRRLSQHGIRSRRGAAALCRRAGRPGRRLPEDGERSRRAGRRRSGCSIRKAISGRSIDAEGMQQELYPYNEPAMMPIEPVIARGGRMAAHTAGAAGPRRCSCASGRRPSAA